MEDVRSRLGVGISFRYYRERTDEDGEDIDDDEEEDSESDDEEWPAEQNKEKDEEETEEEEEEEEEEDDESEEQLAPAFELMTFHFNRGEKPIRGMWCRMQHEGRAVFLRVRTSTEQESSHTADNPETATGDDGDEDEIPDVVDASGTDGGGDDEDSNVNNNNNNNQSAPKTRHNEKSIEIEPASSLAEPETGEGLEEERGELLEERQPLTSTTDEVQLDGKASESKPPEKTMPAASTGVAFDTAPSQTQDTETE